MGFDQAQDARAFLALEGAADARRGKLFTRIIKELKHKKGAADARRGKLFTRIIKELTVRATAGATRR